MKEHTQGPWKVKTLSTEESKFGNNTIRDKYNVPICYGVTEANARLIAAAPELLVALIEAEHTFVNIDAARLSVNERNRRTTSLAIIRAAIAKAKAL